MEKKSNKGIIIALCTVIIVMIGAITYLFVSGTVSLNIKENDKNKTEQKEENKDESKEEQDKENETEKKDEDNGPKQLSLDDPLVQKLYGYVTVSGSENSVSEKFNKYGTITNKTMPNDVKLKIALVVGQLVDEFTYIGVIKPADNMSERKLYQLEKAVVLNKIDEIFGKNNGYQHIDRIVDTGLTTILGQGGCGAVYYNAEKDIYEMTFVDVCGEVTYFAAYNKLISAEKNEDTIVLTSKIYVKHTGPNGIYKTLDVTELISSDISNNVANNEEYFEKGATTKYTFRLAEDGSYYFESKVTN